MKNSWLSGIFSYFYGQLLVTAAWATPSPYGVLMIFFTIRFRSWLPEPNLVTGIFIFFAYIFLNIVNDKCLTNLTIISLHTLVCWWHQPRQGRVKYTEEHKMSCLGPEIGSFFKIIWFWYLSNIYERKLFVVKSNKIYDFQMYV